MFEKRFLFLQGPVSPFFKLLANRLEAEGSKVLKVNFSNGDKFFWGEQDSIDYPHQQKDWQNYIADIARLRKITDLVVYSDSSPAHRQAIEALKEYGINIHVFEEGYLGKNFVTLEQGGVNASTSLPRDPMFYKREQERELPETIDCEASYTKRILYSMEYYLTSLTHEYSNFDNRKELLNENNIKYAALVWAKRVSTSISRKIIAELKEKALRNKDYFVVALQPESDWKINASSNIENVDQFISKIITSFAKHSDKETRIVFKNHPLDNGLAQYKKKISIAAKENKVSKRVSFIDGGEMDSLVSNAKGLVTLNSSSAMTALANGIPVKAMAGAVYDIEGLTNQATLDVFWKGPRKPKEDLFEKFTNYLQYKTQVNGNFYSKKGMELAVENATAKILGLDGSSYYQENITAN